MKEPKTGLLEGETVIRSGKGGHITFVGPQSGTLFLTNKRLFHEAIIGKKITCSVDLKNIAECRIERYSSLFLIIPLLKAIKVFKKDGSSVKFAASDKDGWVVALKEARKGL